MPYRPSTWKLIFPRFKCPHCKKVIRATFQGRFRFGARKSKGTDSNYQGSDAPPEPAAEQQDGGQGDPGQD